MKKLILSLVLACLFMPAVTQGEVIDFEDWSQHGWRNSYTHGDYTLEFDGGAEIGWNMVASPDGDINILSSYAWLRQDTTLQRNDGGAFNLMEFDIFREYYRKYEDGIEVRSLETWPLRSCNDVPPTPYLLTLIYSDGTQKEIEPELNKISPVTYTSDFQSLYEYPDYNYNELTEHGFERYNYIIPDEWGKDLVSALLPNTVHLFYEGEDIYTFSVGFDNILVKPVPEPSSYALMLIGLGGLAWFRRKQSTA